MDNRIFNVNGRTKEQLVLAVACLMLNEYGKQQQIKGWYFAPHAGLVLVWHIEEKNGAKNFTNRMGEFEPINQQELVELLWNWLGSDQAKTVTFSGDDWDHNLDHDGSNDMGWRLYVDEWGHVRNSHATIDHYSVVAFKPCFLWYGK